MFSRRDTVGCEHRSAPPSGNRPQATLNAGSVHKWKIVGVFIAPGNGQSARAQNVRQRVNIGPDRADRRSPPPAYRRSQASAPRASSTTPPSELRWPPANAALIFFVQTRRAESYRRSWRGWLWCKSPQDWLRQPNRMLLQPFTPRSPASSNRPRE